MQGKVYKSPLLSVHLMHKLMEPEVQQASKVNKDFEFGEGCPSDQHLSKIPRPSKSGSPKKKLLKESDRPSSAKSFVTLENKFKASMAKYQKELKEMNSQNDRLTLLRETIVRLRDEMYERGQKDLPNLPDVPSVLSMPSTVTTRSPSTSCNLTSKAHKPEDSMSKLCEFTDEPNKRSFLDNEALEFIKVEMPTLEKTLRNLEEALNLAHEKQSHLEINLDNYKDDITSILNDFENVATIKRNSELLIQELENIKDEFQKERNIFRKEIEAKEEELMRMRGSLETEFSKRKSLEDAYVTVQKERDRIKEDCEDYIKQIEKIQKMQLVPSSIGGVQDLAIQNGQLQYEVDDLKTKLTLTQRKLSTVTEDNDRSKQEVRKLMVEREEIKSEFLNHCQQILFEKENQIYSIKSKMDSIVNLKNSMVIREGRGEPCFSIDMVMNINDTNALKKEVVGLHKRLISFEETRSDLERRLSTKEVTIQSLEEELLTRCQALNKMESLLDVMKRKDKENNEILASLELSSNFSSDQHLTEESRKEDKLKELVRWQEKQREAVAELEKELRTSEERYCLSEERRIRNEERIAMLQLKLAKYQYFR